MQKEITKNTWYEHQFLTSALVGFLVAARPRGANGAHVLDYDTVNG